MSGFGFGFEWMGLRDLSREWFDHYKPKIHITTERVDQIGSEEDLGGGF